jgi:hypothetical protein
MPPPLSAMMTYSPCEQARGRAQLSAAAIRAGAGCRLVSRIAEHQSAPQARARLAAARRAPARVASRRRARQTAWSAGDVAPAAQCASAGPTRLQRRRHARNDAHVRGALVARLLDGVVRQVKHSRSRSVVLAPRGRQRARPHVRLEHARRHGDRSRRSQDRQLAGSGARARFSSARAGEGPTWLQCHTLSHQQHRGPFAHRPHFRDEVPALMGTQVLRRRRVSVRQHAGMTVWQ